MSRLTYTLVLLFSLACCTNLAAGDLWVGEEKGSIVARDGKREFVYKNIVGSGHGVDRSLIELNGLPALEVVSRGIYYFSLVIGIEGVTIDCAYSDVRNVYNGARVSLGKCGLNLPLDEFYLDVAQNHSSVWMDSIYSVNTESVFKTGQGGDFMLGKFGEVEVYDRYASVESLEESAPQKIIKGSKGCFNFGESLVFLVYLNDDKGGIKYLDVVQSYEPLIFERMQADHLKEIAVDEC